MDDESQSLMRRDTWEIVSSKSVDDKMCFWEHGLSIEKGNLIGQSGNSRHDIL